MKKFVLVIAVIILFLIIGLYQLKLSIDKEEAEKYNPYNILNQK